MYIKITIGRDTLGSFNTEEINQDYTQAVQDVLEGLYPDHHITVRLGEHTAFTSDSMDNDDQLMQDMRDVAGRIWDKSEY